MSNLNTLNIVKPNADLAVKPKLEAQGIRFEGNKIVRVKKEPQKLFEGVPLYNPALHRAGDKVLVKPGKKLVETVIPELDADGNPIPDMDFQ